MLTKTQVRKLLDLLAEETVVPPTDGFPFRISRRAPGYSKDTDTAQLQAALSIMLEAARE